MPAPTPVALPHPLVDESGPGWVATFAGGHTVGLSSGRSALFVDAARAGVRVLLVTGRTSRLTYPLYQLLRSTGALWLTRGSDGRLRDASSGVEVGSFAEVADPRFVAITDDAAPVVVRDQADQSPWVQFAVSTHHPARDETTVGRTLETLVDDMAEGSSLFWGSAEPVGQPWDRVAISGLARARMPSDTRVIVAGRGSAGTPWRATIRVARSEIGITEETRVVFAVTDDVLPSTADTVLLLQRVAELQQVLLGSAWSLRGPSDATIPAECQFLPQPIAAVIGARGVRVLGIDPGSTGILGGRSVGNRRAPSLVVGFGGDETGWRRFADMVETIGVSEINAALSPIGVRGGGAARAS